MPFTSRARILVDTAAALNPRDEKGLFKVKGAAHIGRAFELLADIGRPVTATNAYDLLTSERQLKATLENPPHLGHQHVATSPPLLAVNEAPGCSLTNVTPETFFSRHTSTMLMPPSASRTMRILSSML